MDIRRYQLFVEIAEAGSLTQAAKRLGYTQSRASHMVKSLETELGFPLFARKNRAVFLTEAGRALLPAARVLLQGNERIRQVAGRISGRRVGRLEIGSYSSIAALWLPPVIQAFSEENPQVSIRLREGNAQQLERWIDDGSVDFAFLSFRPEQTFRWIPMLDDELMAVLPPSDPLRGLPVIPVDALQGKRFIAPGGLGTEYNVHAALEPGRFMPETRLTAMEDATIISMVAHGLGYSILPRLILDSRPAEVAARPLAPSLHRTLGIGISRACPISPAAADFITCALKRYQHEAYQETADWNQIHEEISCEMDSLEK